MPFIPLKPTEESFVKICRNMTKKFRTIVLFEGDDDIQRFNELISKMNINCQCNVGITQCEGYPTINEVARYTASIASVSRTLRQIIIVVDADEYTATERVNAIRTSLSSYDINITNLEEVSESIYRLQWDRGTILVKVAGLTDLPFPNHMMEDYLVRILISSGQIETNQLEDFRCAKDFLEENGYQKQTIIEQAEIQIVREAFEKMLNMLNLIEEE